MPPRYVFAESEWRFQCYLVERGLVGRESVEGYEYVSGGDFFCGRRVRERELVFLEGWWRNGAYGPGLLDSLMACVTY